MLVNAQQYSDVVEIPNKTSVQLYRAAQEWFAVTFNSSKDVIQLEDSIQKKIIGKGIKPVKYRQMGVTSNLDVYFTLIVQFKDGRYKYDMQTGEINPQTGGNSYSYELFKSMTTEEGILAYYKTINLKPWMVGKAQMQKNIENTKLMLVEIDSQLNGLVNSLTQALKKDDKSSSW